MARKNMVVLIPRPGYPGQEVPRELVATTLTALHFLERQRLITTVQELYRLCQQSTRYVVTSYGAKLLEEGLVEAYNKNTAEAKLSPAVRAIVLAAVTVKGSGQVRIARQPRDIIQS